MYFHLYFVMYFNIISAKFSTKVEDEALLMNSSNCFLDLILSRIMFNLTIKIVLASYLLVQFPVR